MQSIDKLGEKLWFHSVMERAAKDQKTVERWQTDEYAHLTERYVVRAMPSDLTPLVAQALSQWDAIEQRILAELKMDYTLFLNGFEAARKNMISGNENWKDFIEQVQDAVCGAVVNMDWVNLFSWVLPKADVENAEKYREIGKRVAAFYYSDLLSRHNNISLSNKALFDRMEARWKMVCPTVSVEDLHLMTINQLVKDFQKNPYLYLYESDIQSALFGLLRNRITETINIPGNNGRGYPLSVIYSEYLEKIDLVCIDSGNLENVDPSPNKGFETYIYNLPLLVGIELKYSKMGDGFSLIRRVRADYDKLKSLEKIKHKLAIGFIQNETQEEMFCREIENGGAEMVAGQLKSLDGMYVVTPSKIYTL